MDINNIAPITPLPILNQIPSVMEKFQINTPLRLAHFLGQAAHESNNFNSKIENLNYSDVNRIVAIFRKDNDLNHNKIIEPSELENAKRFVHNPEGLANFVYANQNGNGPESSGEGWKYRGRGYFCLTGKSNYVDFDNYVPENIVDNPNLVSDKYPLMSSAWFWNSHKLNELADVGEGHDTIIKITKVINGGTIGLDERIKLIDKYYNLLKS